MRICFPSGMIFGSLRRNFSNNIRVKNTHETQLQKLCPLALGNYRESFLVLFKFLKEQFDKSRQIRIPLMLLKNEEIKELNDIRDYFIGRRALPNVS